MRILVTGASGFIGSALIKYLGDFPGLFVVGMLRCLGSNYENCPFEYRLSDIANLDETDIDLSDIDVIIHTAGRAHIINEKSSNSLQEFRNINTFGTLELATLAAKSGVKRFVFLSSIKVNGENNALGVPFSIDSKEDPQDAYGISKYEAEIGLKKISAETGLEVTIIRPPMVYGPGAKGNLNLLMKALSLRLPLPFALVKNNLRSMIGLDNLLSVTKLCALHPKAANQTFLISDKHDLSTSELILLLGHSINKPVILFKVPIFLLLLIAKIFRIDNKIGKIVGTLQVDISYTCNHLGWEPPFSVEDGFKKISTKRG